MTTVRTWNRGGRKAWRLAGALLASWLAAAAAAADTVLPRPAQPFAGSIGTSYAD